MASSKDIRAGGAFLELGLKDKLDKGLATAKAKMKAFAKGAALLGGALVGGASAVLAPLLGAVSKFGKVGDDFAKMSDRTGASVESLSQLSFAAERTGSDMGGLAKAMFTANQIIGESLGGTAAALDELKLSADDLSNATPDKNLETIADALAGIGNAARRDALGVRIFGESFKDIQPLLDQGGEGIEKLKQQADELGLTMTGKDANAAAEYSDAMGTLKDQAKAVTMQLGASLAPVLTKILKATQPILTQAITWVKENRGLIVTIASVAAGVGAAGVALLLMSAIASAAATAIGFFGTVVSFVGGIIGFLLSPIGLVLVGVGALVAGLLYFTDVGSKAGSVISDSFSQIKEIVGPTIESIKAALSAGDLSLAAKIAMAGLKLVFAEGMLYLVGLMNESFGDGVGTIISNVLEGDLQGAWNSTVDFLGMSWFSMVDSILDYFGGAVDSILDMWENMASTVSNTITDLNLFNEKEIGEKGLGLDRERAAELKENVENYQRLAKLAAQIERGEQVELTDREKKELGDTSSDRFIELANSDARQLKALSSTLGRGATDDIKAVAREIIQAKRDAGKASFEGFRKSNKEKISEKEAKLAGGSELLEAQRNQLKKELDELSKEAKILEALSKVDPKKDIKKAADTTLATNRTSISSGFAAAFLGQTGGPQERIAKAAEKTVEGIHELIDVVDKKDGIVLA